KGRSRWMRASTLWMVSTSSGLKGQNGTRVEPKKPFNVLVLASAPPAVTAELTLTVAGAGLGVASVVMLESSQPLIRYRATAELLDTNFGFHRKLITARWRWSSSDVPLSPE